MSELFGNLDVLKILGYGLSGLSLLLMMMGYNLLKQVIQAKDPKPAVISLVKFYLAGTVIVLIIVGLFSIPIAGRNSELKNDNTKLSNIAGTLVLSQEVHDKFDDILQSTDTATTRKKIGELKVLSDSLAVTAAGADPGLAESSNSLKGRIDLFASRVEHGAAGTNPAANRAEAASIQKELSRSVITPIRKSVMVRRPQ
jgi:hypothetical protein